MKGQVWFCEYCDNNSFRQHLWENLTDMQHELLLVCDLIPESQLGGNVLGAEEQLSVTMDFAA